MVSRTLRRVGSAVNEALDAAVTQLGEIKVRADQAKKDREEVAPVVLEQLKDAGKTKHRVPWDETNDVVATIRERDNSKIDPERLKKAIGAKQFNKLTTPQLDMAKVEASIQLGELDANIVAQCTEESISEYVDVRFNKAQKRK